MHGIDAKIVLFFQSIRCEALTKLFYVFIPLEFWMLTAVILVLFFLFRTKKLLAPVVSFVIAWDLSEYCYVALKHLVHRPRPFLTVHGAVPLITPHGFSFPSGHATLAMAMAVVLTYYFPKGRYPIYVLAVLVGLSRVYFGTHYLSDVLAGFVLGGLLGFLSLFLEKAVISVAKKDIK
jgi:undecaprenyl-diphosphatase